MNMSSSGTVRSRSVFLPDCNIRRARVLSIFNSFWKSYSLSSYQESQFLFIQERQFSSLQSFAHWSGQRYFFVVVDTCALGLLMIVLCLCRQTRVVALDNSLSSFRKLERGVVNDRLSSLQTLAHWPSRQYFNVFYRTLARQRSKRQFEVIPDIRLLFSRSFRHSLKRFSMWAHQMTNGTMELDYSLMSFWTYKLSRGH